MTDPTPEPRSSGRLGHVFSALFLLAGLVAFDSYSENWFESSAGRFNWARIICGLLVGAGAGAFGYGIGWAVEKWFRN